MGRHGKKQEESGRNRNKCKKKQKEEKKKLEETGRNETKRKDLGRNSKKWEEMGRHFQPFTSISGGVSRDRPVGFATNMATCLVYQGLNNLFSSIEISNNLALKPQCLEYRRYLIDI